MKTLTVTLKQHTPLIHFQYDQDGATLRASEVKPRLDKYLIENDHPNNFNFWKDYLVGNVLLSEKQLELPKNQSYKTTCEQKLEEKFRKGFRALDYKMRIKLRGSSSRLDWDNYPMYFGNQGTADYKYGMFCDKDISLEFSSEHDKLLDIIKKKLPDFMSQTNFGTRQTKGYGCFYIKGEMPQNANYCFTIEADDMKNALELLADFYAVLRAGINNQGLYIKSALFKYLKEVDHAQWDKKTIKQEYYSEEEKKQELEDHENEPLPQKEVLLFTVPETDTMYKELMGLSTVEVWQPKGATIKTTLTRFHVHGEDKEIKRFKSPILFKPIKIEKGDRNGYTMKVFIYISDIPQRMRNQKFKIRWGNREDLEMTTSDTFSLNNYFQWIYDNRNKLMEMLAFARPGNKNAPTRRSNIDKMFKTIKKVEQ